MKKYTKIDNQTIEEIDTDKAPRSIYNIKDLKENLASHKKKVEQIETILKAVKEI